MLSLVFTWVICNIFHVFFVTSNIPINENIRGCLITISQHHCYNNKMRISNCIKLPMIEILCVFEYNMNECTLNIQLWFINKPHVAKLAWNIHKNLNHLNSSYESFNVMCMYAVFSSQYFHRLYPFHMALMWACCDANPKNSIPHSFLHSFICLFPNSCLFPEHHLRFYLLLLLWTYDCTIFAK